MIPVLDLTAQYQAIKPEIDRAIEGVLSSGIFVMGPNVDAFESEIASYLGVKHAISLNSGTDALHLALRALDIGPGDEVITSPFTFVATSEAISMVGASPVFVDIDPISFNIDPGFIESAISPRTKAILPIHLYGCPADLAAIQRIASKHGLAVIEDCAQAVGADIEGRKVGTQSTAGCYSFFPTKNLGAYGDGGLVTTNDGAFADRLRALRTHGARTKYFHEELGVNSRLDEIQAAVLRVKLVHLDSWIAARRRVASNYSKALAGEPGVTVPSVVPSCSHVYHQYTIRLSERDEVRRRLALRGVQTMVYYPTPLHLQPIHRDKSTQHFPQAELAAQQVLSLPLYPELTSEMQEKVIEALVDSKRGAVGV
jgi:dTDP-4-amino-4,6-dideoxygalactose transaminase